MDNKRYFKATFRADLDKPIIQYYDNQDNGKTKTAYQQNISQPIEPYKAPETTRDMLGQIYRMSSFDIGKSRQAMNMFTQLQQTPGSAYYNPYAKATNSAVNNLITMGFDTDNLTDDWFNANNNWISSNLLYNGTTNTPSKPGKKATADQKLAYELYQYQKSEADTKKAEQQWEALQEELTYWAQQKDRNLSDDQILGMIDWSKYGELDSMYSEEHRYSPKEYNRAIGYSDDAMYGVLWAARNPEFQGDIYEAMANSALGVGNVWKENPDITAKLNANDASTYSPYEVGSTLQEERAYFDVPEFNRDVLNKIAENPHFEDKTWTKMYKNVEYALDMTEKLQKEEEEIYKDVDTLLESFSKPEEIISILQEKADYKDLFALDETLDSTSQKYTDLIPTTSAISYRWDKVEAYINQKCAEKAAKSNVTNVANAITDTVVNTPATTPVATETPPIASAPAKTMQDVRNEASFLMGVNWSDSVNPSKESFEVTDEKLRAAYDAKWGAGAYDKAMSETTDYTGNAMGANVSTPASVPAPTAAPTTTPVNPTAVAATPTPAATVVTTPVVNPVDDGFVYQGNIDIDNRPVVFNADGTISTERSISIGVDGMEYVIPTVINGKVVTEDEAKNHFFETGEYLGKFATVKEAEDYAQALHEHQERVYQNRVENDIPTQTPVNAPATAAPVNPIPTATPTQAPVSDVSATAPTQAPVVTAAPKGAPAFSEAEIAIEDAAINVLTELEPVIENAGTEGEKLAIKTGMTAFFDQTVEYLTNLVGDFQQSMGWKVVEQIKGSYMDAVRGMIDYDKHKANLEDALARTEETEAEFQALDDRYEYYDKLSKMTQQEYQDLRNVVTSENWEYYKEVLSHPEYVTDEYQQENYDNALLRLFEEVNGINSSGDMDYIRQKGQEYWDVLKRAVTEEQIIDNGKGRPKRITGNAVGIFAPEEAPLTDKERERYRVLNDLREELDTTIINERKWLKENEEAYNGYVQDKFNTYALAGFASLTGADEDATMLPSIEYLLKASQNESWIERTPYSLFDTAVMQGQMSKADAITQASVTAVNDQKAADVLRGTLGFLDGYGISVEPAERKGINQLISALEHEGKGAEYVALDGQEDFDEMVAKGKEAAAGDRGNAKLLTYFGVNVPDYGTGDYYQLIGELTPAYAIVEENKNQWMDTLRNITQEEVNRYFYLYGKDGKEAADKYFAFITDPEYGELTTRASMDWQERRQEFASRGPLEAAGATLASFFTKPFDVVGGLGYRIAGGSNPNSPFLVSQTSGLRQGAKSYLDKVFGDNNVLDKLYDVATGLGDVVVGSKLFSWAGTLGTSAYMSEGAANQAYQNALIQTHGNTDAAHRIAAVSAVADVLSHAIVINGVNNAIQFQPDMLADKVSQAVAMMFKNAGAVGASTLAGEAFKDTVLNDIMKLDGTERAQIKQKYLDMDYSNSMAEDAANREMSGMIWERAVSSAFNSVLRDSLVLGAKEIGARIEDKGGIVNIARRWKASHVASELNTADYDNYYVDENGNIVLTQTKGYLGDGSEDPMNDTKVPAGGAIIPSEANKASADAAMAQMQKDMTLLMSTYSSSPTATSVVMASVLGEGKSGAAAGQRIVGIIAQNDTKLATQTVESLLLNGAEKTDITYAAMTKGSGRAALENVFAKAKNGEMITEADVKAISDGLSADRALGPQKFENSFKAAVRASMASNKTLSILRGNGAEKTVKAAKVAVMDARENVRRTQKASEEASDKLAAIGENLKQVESEYDPANKETAAPLQQTTNELLGAIDVANQREEEANAAQGKLQQAQEELSNVSNEVLAQARPQALTEVDQEIQQEEEAAYNNGIAMLQPVRPFGRSIEVYDTNNLPVRITGIYDIPGDTTVYTTEDGHLITDSDRVVATHGIRRGATGRTIISLSGGVQATDNPEIESAVQAGIDAMFGDATSGSGDQRAITRPAVYFPRSFEGTVNGQPVHMIGIAGREVIDGMDYPVIMDIDGNTYSTEDPAVEIPFEMVDSVDETFDQYADDLDPVKVQAVTGGNENEEPGRELEPGQTAEPVQGDAGTWNNEGQLPSAPGRDVGLGDNGNVGPDGGEGVHGRAEESQPERIRPDTSRVSERLLSKDARQTLHRKGVTSTALQQETDPQRFSSALDAARENNSHKLFVDPQSPEDLEEKGAIMLKSRDGLIMGAVGSKGIYDGDIFAVCKNPKSRARNASKNIIISAIAQGGNKLDCYNGTPENNGLPRMYSSVGMVPVARVEFSRDFHKNDGWNYERDGEPDVIFWMLKPGETAESVIENYGKPESEGGYHIYTYDELAMLPVFEDTLGADGKPTEFGYDKAWAFRDEWLAKGEIPESTLSITTAPVDESSTQNDVSSQPETGLAKVMSNYGLSAQDHEGIPQMSDLKDASGNSFGYTYQDRDGNNRIGINQRYDTEETRNFLSNEGYSYDATTGEWVSGSTQSGVSDIQPMSFRRRPQTATNRQAAKVRGKIQSPQKIAQRLTKSLGFGNYLGSNNFGDLPANVQGYWSKHAHLVAVKDKEIGDYTTTMHEDGHGVGQALGLRGTPDMVTNLLAEAPEFATHYSPRELKDEAFAEFFWRYLEDDSRARAFAGDDYVDDFERQLVRHPGMNKAVQEAKSQLRAWINADSEERFQALIQHENDPGEKSFKESVRSMINQVIDNTSIAQDVDDFAKSGGTLRRQALFANHAQKRAVVNLTDNLTDSNGTIIGDGLAARMTDAGFPGTEESVHKWEEYALLKHSFDKGREDKPVFGNMGEPERAARITEMEQKYPWLKDVEDAFQSFRHDFLKAWMVDTGYWTEDFLTHLDEINPHYVPTFRVRGRTDPSGNPTGWGRANKKYTMKAAVGGSEDIYSPFYSFIGMVDQITSMVATNQIAREFDRLYESTEGMGIFGRQIPGEGSTAGGGDSQTLNSRQRELANLLNGQISGDMMDKVLDIVKSNPGVNQSKSSGQNILTVQREDGTTVQYEIDNPELFKLLTGVQGSSGIRILQAVGALTRGMSMLTTGSNPLFAARNAVRDFQNSVNYGSWASNYLTGIPKWFSALFDVIRKSPEYQQYEAMGGGGWQRIQQGSAKSMKEIQTEMFGDDKSSVGKTAKWLGKKLWNIVTMDKLNEWIEQASRFVEVKYGKHDKSTPEGWQEAFQAGQDVTVDFSRSGNSELAYVLKKIVPFFNASAQGVNRFGRQFTEAERDRLGVRLTKTIVNTAIMSALSLGLILKYGDEEDKEEYSMLSDGVKANHLILPNPLKGEEGQPPFIRVPLGQDPIMYGVHSLVTNALFNGSDDEMAITLGATADVILDTLNPLGSGTIFQPFVDASHNKTWYGSNIVRTSQTDWTDEAGKYNEDTPEIFKTLGRLMNTSPEVVEYLATQYTGFLGAMAIPALSQNDDGSIGGFDAVMRSIIKKWTADPASSNDVTKSFYDMKNDFTTITGQAKAERPEGLLLRSLTQDEVNEAYEKAAEMQATGGIIYETSKLITDTYKKIDSINANDTLTDNEKYELTNSVKMDMLKQVQAANEEMEAYMKKYEKGETLTDRIFGGIRKMFEEGKIAHIKTDIEKLPETFQADVEDPESKYMQMSLSVYNDANSPGYQKQAALPHPDQTFTKDDVDYEIPDDEWDAYTKIYKDEYKAYIATKGGDWDTMTEKKKYDLLKAAHSAANKKMKEAFVKAHPAQ